MNMQNNRRKTLLINKTFQLSFIKYSFIFLCLIFGVFIVVGHWLIAPIYDYANEMGMREIGELNIILEELKFYAPIVLGLLFVVICCFFAAASLLISHKIAGPLYNLEESMKLMLENKELRSIHFRKDDYFNSLEKSFNQFVDKMTLK